MKLEIVFILFYWFGMLGYGIDDLNSVLLLLIKLFIDIIFF